MPPPMRADGSARAGADAANNDDADAAATDAAAPRVDAQHPWPGMAAYDEAAQHFFFGRVAETEELLRLVTGSPLTVVYGRSGLGKSSLLQAGLFPPLRRAQHLPVYLRIDFADPGGPSAGDQTLRRLYQEVARVGAEMTPPHDGSAIDLWAFLHRRGFEIWSADNQLLTPVFVFDQFEELFSRSDGRVEQVREVFNGLADLIENRIPSGLRDQRERCAALDLLSRSYRVVLSFREDFLPDIEAWKDQLPSLLHNRLRLLPMTRAAATAATESAGAAVLAPGAAARIVDFVASRDGGLAGSDSTSLSVEPVLLSLCCTQLNRRRAPAGRIDARLLSEAGDDILQSFYRDALDGLPERVPRFIETQLIQGDRWRGSYPRDEAIASGAIGAAELAQLTDRYRLLRIDQQADTARIELIHDRLVGAVRQARDERLARERDAQRAAELARAEQQARDETERRRQAEAAQARLRRTRNALVGVALLLVGAIGWALLSARDAQRQTAAAQASAVQASQAAAVADLRASEAGAATRTASAAREQEAAQRRLARARELIAFSLQQLDRDPELSVLLAAEAVRTNDDDGTRGALEQALAQSFVRVRLPASDSPLTGALFFAGDRQIVTAAGDGALQVWDAASGRRGAALRAHRGPIRGLWIGEQGRTILAWSDGRGGADSSRRGAPAASAGGRAGGTSDSLLTAWNGESAAPAWQLRLPGVTRVDVSSCCRRLLVRSSAGLLLLDQASGREIARQALDVDFNGAGFTDGGKRFLVVGTSYEREPDAPISLCSRWRLQHFSADNGAPADEPVVWPAGYGSVEIEPRGGDIVSASTGRAEMGESCSYLEEPVWLLVGHRKTVRLAGSPDGGRFSAHAFSPVDENSVALGAGQTVQVWSVSDIEGQARASVRLQSTHTARVVDVAFSPDGTLLLGSDVDDTVRVLATRAQAPLPIAVLRARGHRIVQAVFSADNRRVLTAGADGSARLWALPALGSGYPPLPVALPSCTDCRSGERWLAFAAGRLTRGLTPAERRQYGFDPAG